MRIAAGLSIAVAFVLACSSFTTASDTSGAGDAGVTLDGASAQSDAADDANATRR